MPYTPVELRHVRVSRSLFGYRPGAVQELLAEIAESFETVWRERHEFADQLEDLEGQLEEVRQRERALTQTLVAAEQAATDIKEQAKREAELILAEAHGEARSVTRAAQAERERLHVEARRIESLMRAALGMIDEAAPAEEPAAEQESWPNRDHTGEFGAPVAEEADDLGEPAEARQPALQKVSGGFNWGSSG
jgi:cell division initiation protein